MMFVRQIITLMSIASLKPNIVNPIKVTTPIIAESISLPEIKPPKVSAQMSAVLQTLSAFFFLR